MPKIIENLEARLVAEAKKQIEEGGYSSLTIRSVATACGVGVGTVYNYFSSKDHLLAAYLLEDWNSCITAVRETSQAQTHPAPVVECIYSQLAQYSHRHRKLFTDEAAMSAFSGALRSYHSLLRSQLAAPLEKFCESSFQAEFITEALLTWTMAGKSFQEIYSQLVKLFSNTP